MLSKLTLIIASLFFPDEDPQFVYDAEKVDNEFLSIIEKQHGICLIAFGGGSYPEISGIDVLLKKEALLTKDEARRLIVHLYDSYITFINSKKHLRPYLETYPLEGNGISLYLYLGPEVFPKLGRVMIYKKFITYKTMLNNNWCAPNCSIEETETLEEARTLIGLTR